VAEIQKEAQRAVLEFEEVLFWEGEIGDAGDSAISATCHEPTDGRLLDALEEALALEVSAEKGRLC
jgi:hypothetical protein